MSKYCATCGTKLAEEDCYCPNCGTGTEQEAITMNSRGKARNGLSFVGNMPVPLTVSGLIMSLLSLPGVAWFSSNFYGTAYGLLKEYAQSPYGESARRELTALERARFSSNCLEFFALGGLLLMIIGILLYVLEKKSIIRKSERRNLFLFAIPIIVAIIVAIFAYPTISYYIHTYC